MLCCFSASQRAVQTSGSEVQVKSGRVSVTDHPEDLAFTVTLDSLTADDAGKYRCGAATILKEEGLLGFLPDPFFQVQVIVSPASSSNSSTWTSGSLSQQQGYRFSTLHFFIHSPNTNTKSLACS
ncbi:protein CD300H-like isoform X2 [Cervus canadensis]|uniref:protein CD300H-like isoform X2 n=1 Tax=Cervus canadensis TaxID=1574408 RepID=UPI001C9E5243|nr:protein CD300H-like isoform X2 [Cervus canadensis]